MPLIRKSSSIDCEAKGVIFDPQAALISANPDERYAAARALATKQEGIETLARALTGETDARVREAILTSLLQIDSARSVELLLPYIRSEHAEIRTGVLDALRTVPMETRRHIDFLLGDREADVRLLACDLLRDQRGEDATAVLSALLDVETDVNVCAAALDVLAEVGTPMALPALQRCRERFLHSPFIVFAIHAAADRIGRQL